MPFICEERGEKKKINTLTAKKNCGFFFRLSQKGGIIMDNNFNSDIFVEIPVELCIAIVLGVPFDLNRTLELFMLCKIISNDFELPLQFLIPNQLLKCIIIDLISNTAALLMLDGYISDPASYFIVTVIGSVIKYFLKNKLNERVDNYSLL